MTEPSPNPEGDPAASRRAKLLGRLMIIGLGLLVLAYLIPTLMSARR